MTKLYKIHYPSPIGILEIIGTTEAITEIRFMSDEEIESHQPNTPQPDLPLVVKKCHTELAEYFTGSRQQFSVALAPQGTPFQQSVWQALLDIPFGQTSTYLAVSKQINNEKAIRAVGQANGRNPIGIIIPCHRVIGSDRTLTGYGGGLWRKKWLLEHEKADIIMSKQLRLKGLE
ncbi:methylated-DNA--[protein]-cysteine S-methyltransferase [Anaerolineales bacterium HSG6]|nr:methylated-DNA--[protein]-cysteine S-methyltransferase [Anaerolineales bacterium HSG6]